MSTLFSIELDRQAKLSIYTAIGLLCLLGYLVGLILLLMTHPVENSGHKSVWTCRLRERAEQDGFELLEKTDMV